MTPEGITVIVGLGASLGYGVWVDWRKRGEVTTLTAANDKLAEIRLEMAETWRKQYEDARAEVKTVRDFHHDKAQEVQKTVLVISEENAQLKAKTDLTSVLEYIHDDKKITIQIVDTLSKISEQCQKSSELIQKLIEKQHEL